jgi:hypothetical protein
MEHMMRDYAAVIRIALEQARLNVNITKSTYDVPVEEDFSYLKDTIGKMLCKIAKGERLKPPYRVRIPGKTWRDSSGYCYFNAKDEAIKYCIGLALLAPNDPIELDKLDANQENYQTEPFDIKIPCAICGKDRDDDIIFQRTGRAAHVKCIRAEIQDAKSRKRMGTVRLGKIDRDGLTKHGECFESQCERNYDLESAYVYTTGRSCIVLRIFKTCTKLEMTQMIESITAQYAKGMH